MPYPSGPFTPDSTYGKYGEGTSFQDCKALTGQMIKGFKLWLGDDAFNGLQYTFSGGETITRGSPSGTSAEITLGPGESVINIHISTSKSSNRPSRFWMATSHDRVVEIGGSAEVDRYSPPFASGYLAGFTGSCTGDQLNSLGCIFLLDVKKVVVSNMSYPGFQTLQTPFPHSLLNRTFRNDSHSSTLKTSVAAGEAHTKGYSFASDSTKAFSGKVVLTGKIPTVVSTSDNQGKWVLNPARDAPPTKTESLDIAETLKLEVAPNTTLYGYVWCVRGEVDTDYASDVRIVFGDSHHSDITFKEKGMFQSTQWSGPMHRLSNAPVSELPPEGKDAEHIDSFLVDEVVLQKEKARLELERCGERHSSFWRRLISCGFRGDR